MQVHGAVIPPPTALEAVAAVVRSVPEPVAVAPAATAAQTKGILGRFGRRSDDDVEEPVPAPAMLEHVPLSRLTLPITGFGNLTTHDANRLADLIAEEAASWAPATLRFAGGTALDFPGDWSVWAKLEGDLDALGAMARGVMQSVEGLGFFVDRRQFRPMLSVATVTPATTGPFLEQVVEALDAFRGEEWTVAVSLTKETFVGSTPETSEFRRISIG
jgi:2'-5' RNA ligase